MKLLGVQLTQRTFLICLFVLLILAIGYRIYKFRKPGAISVCSAATINTFIGASNASPKGTTTIIQPSDVVVEPWHGRHNIYATFQVPTGFKPHKSVIVMVDGIPYCGYIEPTNAKVNTTSAPKTITAKFRTRTALWLISKGYGEKLKQPHNWQLVITKQS